MTAHERADENACAKTGGLVHSKFTQEGLNGLMTSLHLPPLVSCYSAPALVVGTVVVQFEIHGPRTSGGTA
jgi:hypothetical protein